jgi:hypothetical protein
MLFVSAALMVIEGTVLLVYGLQLALPPLPFYGDVAACFVGGTGILYSGHRVVRQRDKS